MNLRKLIFSLIMIPVSSLPPNSPWHSPEQLTSVIAFEQKLTEISIVLSPLNDTDKSVLNREDIGCYQIIHQANLSACLQSCDGSQIIPLTSESKYRDIWLQADQFRFNHNIFKQVSANELELKIISTEKKLPTFLVTTQESNESASLCAQNFDGDRCIENVSELILRNNPFENYKQAMEYFIFFTDADIIEPAIKNELENILSLLNQLESAFEQKKIHGFLHQGSYFSKNIQNAPALFCQLKSREAGFAGPMNTLLGALMENEKELLNSLDLLQTLQ